jgi:hypothetical protein
MVKGLLSLQINTGFCPNLKKASWKEPRTEIANKEL